MAKAAVIGAGPAGLSAALGLLRANFNVTVYEQREHWTNRVCGAFLNPEAVRHLQWLGVLEKARARNSASVAIARVFDNTGRSMELPLEQNGTAGLALSRKDLEEILLEAVRERGGRVEFGARVKDANTFSADVVVAASGRFSNRAPGETGWYGWNASFSGAAQTPGTLSLHFYPGGYVGVITFADGSSNVSGLVRRRGREKMEWPKIHEHALAHSPSLTSLLKNAAQTSEWRGVGPLPFSLSMQKDGERILAGDAAAVGDPYMGEGLGRALAAGPMIHDAWAQNQGENFNARYQKLWQNHYAPRLKLGHATRLLLGSSPLFQITMMLVFSARGAVARALPVFHGGFHGSHVSYS